MDHCKDFSLFTFIIIMSCDFCPVTMADSSLVSTPRKRFCISSGHFAGDSAPPLPVLTCPTSWPHCMMQAQCQGSRNPTTLAPKIPILQDRRLWLSGYIWPAACFCKYNLIGMQPCPFIHLLSVATSVLQWQSLSLVKELWGLQSLKYLLSAPSEIKLNLLELKRECLQFSTALKVGEVQVGRLT